MSLELEKARLEEESLVKFFNRSTKREIKIVAEGDSWFDYPLSRDIIDCLRKMGYGIFKQSEAGDTLENMVYGTEHKVFSRQGKVVNHGSRDLDATLNAIKENKPQFVLFSAGGNDVVGKELVQYLNHERSRSGAISLIRKELFENNMNGPVREAVANFIENALAIDPNIHILMDGYDYAKPNGKSYRIAGLKLSGPWILPSMGAKNIVDRNKQDDIIKYLVDGFNNVLKSLDSEYDQFHHIDLRGMFPHDYQWDNEIHLKGDGFEEVAKVYHSKICQILSKDPLI
jgi:hypothetical protein